MTITGENHAKRRPPNDPPEENTPAALASKRTLGRLAGQHLHNGTAAATRPATAAGGHAAGNREAHGVGVGGVKEIDSEGMQLVAVTLCRLAELVRSSPGPMDPATGWHIPWAEVPGLSPIEVGATCLAMMDFAGYMAEREAAE